MKVLQWLSDRLELLPTETRIKLDNEKAKVNMSREKSDFEKAKSGGNNNDSDGVFYQRFILGLWVLSKGVIYDMFNKEKHIVPTVNRKEEQDK